MQRSAESTTILFWIALRHSSVHSTYQFQASMQHKTFNDRFLKMYLIDRFENIEVWVKFCYIEKIMTPVKPCSHAFWLGHTQKSCKLETRNLSACADSSTNIMKCSPFVIFFPFWQFFFTSFSFHFSALFVKFLSLFW